MSSLRFMTLPLLFAIALTPRGALAEDQAGAQALMDEALKLTAAKRYVEACPKLEESLRLYESLNTEYFLADCWEHTGRLASAWVAFGGLAEKAHDAGEKAKEQKALERELQVRPRVPHLTIQVLDATVAGLDITRDGVDVGAAQWGLPMPVDLGMHEVVATAPNRATFTTQLIISAEGQQLGVTVPVLAVEQPADPGPKPSDSEPVEPVQAVVVAPRPTFDVPPPAASGAGRKIVGFTLAGLGAVSLTMGGIFGLVAKGQYDSATSCKGTVCDNQDGLDKRNQARSLGNAATLMVVLGGAAVVGGTILILTAPSPPVAGAAVSKPRLQLGLTAGGALVAGTF